MLFCIQNCPEIRQFNCIDWQRSSLLTAVKTMLYVEFCITVSIAVIAKPLEPGIYDGWPLTQSICPKHSWSHLWWERFLRQDGVCWDPVTTSLKWPQNSPERDQVETPWEVPDKWWSMEASHCSKDLPPTRWCWTPQGTPAHTPRVMWLRLNKL